jgi:hypothetical protein
MARYGFGFDGFPAENLAPSDRVIDTPPDLFSALQD